jgi:hypothetical protein
MSTIAERPQPSAAVIRNAPTQAAVPLRRRVDDVLASPGQALDSTARSDMERHFGHDFGNVRVHSDARAAESAKDAGALAYTVGPHVVFGAGQYAPETPAGRHLLAHELTHTIQQRSAVAMQRQEAAGGAPREAAEVEADRVADQVAGGFIVDDEASEAGPGQMRRTEFLDELQRASCAAADAELARVGRSTEGCPFVERAFGRYRTMPAARVEQAIRRYADPAGVTSARDYIPRVSRRVGEGVARWAQTGDMSDVPPELAADASGGVMGMLGGGLSGLVGGIGRLLFKRDGGGGATPGEAALVATRLGAGAPLESGVRGRMESAFGYDFSRVRIHSGESAAALSSSLGARAFTLGTDIGFGASEYRPNTLFGDALIAHELAHVVQQSGGGNPSAAVEEDADHSAAGAMVSVWTGAKQVAKSALPRLRSGLGLQRCASTPPRPVSAASQVASCAPVDAAQWRTGVTNAQALTDDAQKSTAMTGLVRQALCALNMSVAEAGSSSRSTVAMEDYQPHPAINFDVHLNSKSAREGGRSLSTNVGYSFTHTRGTTSTTYSVLGPLSLDPNTPLKTRLYAEHEMDIARVGQSVSDNNAELRVWTSDFIRYFHQYLALPIQQRPSWSTLGTYYDRADASEKRDSISRIAEYYRHPPATVNAEELQRAFSQWMHRQGLRSEFQRDLNAELNLVAP